MTKGAVPHPVSVLPSSPHYEKINELWNMYALVKNSQMFFGDMDVDEVQRKDIEEQLEYLMEQVLRQQSIQLMYAVYSAGFEW